MTDAEQVRARIVDFLGDIARPGSDLKKVANDDHLVDKGIIDSLATIQIILFLEREYGVSLANRGISPADILSIGGILGAIEKQA